MDVSDPLRRLVAICKNIQISDIGISKYNARDTKLEANNNPGFLEFRENIRTNGLIEPIVIRQNPATKEYETVAGTRRLRALKSLGAVQVPAIIRNDLDDNDVRIFSLAENIQRRNLEEDEIQDCLIEIYKNSAKSWKPPVLTNAEKITIEKHGDEGLAQTYLKRLHNEQTKGYGKSSKKAQIAETLNTSAIGGRHQEINPTSKFKSLADRTGYAYSTQYNILRGAGSFRTETDYLAELPEDVQQVIEEQVKKAIEEDEALKEQERLDKEKELKQKAAWRYRTRTKTKKIETPKAERGRKKAVETKAKKKPTKTEQALDVVKKVIKKEKQQREEKEADNVQKGWTTNNEEDKIKSTDTKPKTTSSVVRTREEIIVLCTKLFRLLTTQELNVNDLSESERIATSKAAKDQMDALAAFFADSGDRALQQSVIIPTSKLLSAYTDILYEAVRNAKRQDDIMHV